MKRSIAAGAAAVLALALLAGCGDDDDPSADDTPSETSSPTSEPTPSEEPTTDFGPAAKGPVIKGTGYSFRAPKGWTNITASARDVVKSVDRVAGEASTSDGFQDNVYVSFDSAPGSTLEELEASVPDQVADTIRQLDVRPHVYIDGVEALHHRGVSRSGPTKYLLDQFVTLDDDGKITVITFSFSPDLGKAARKGTVDSVMASWKWRA